MKADLEIVLVKTRFPENIGMVARACANFGCENICLVNLEKRDLINAIPLATPKGLHILKNIRYASDFAEAIISSNLVIGTTARTGGWRKNIISPDEAAEIIITSAGQKISLVFGPEDRGLLNSEIITCNYLVHIPTSQEASSLNLAQAVLIMLYEHAKAEIKHKNNINKNKKNNIAKVITNGDKERVIQNLKNMLLEIDYLHGENPDYFMLQWRNFFDRINLKRHEYAAIMGLCRQIHNKLKSKQ